MPLSECLVVPVRLSQDIMLPVDPLGGVSVQSFTDVGAGQTAASGEGEGGGPRSPKERTEESGMSFRLFILFICALICF